jgi:hypothetical protein
LGVEGHLREEAARSCGGGEAGPPQCGEDLMFLLPWQVPRVGGEVAIPPVREVGVGFSLRWMGRQLCQGTGNLHRGRRG